jgi:hypothetical protein
MPSPSYFPVVKSGNVQTVVNVQGFGATGNGTTDDTAAIQAAINSAFVNSATVPQGGVVYFPVGTYMISTPLVVPPYVTLQGTYMQRGSVANVVAIKATSTFVGSGLVTMVDATTGGYLTTSEGQRFFNLTIDGTLLGATVAAGILATGLVHGVMMKDVSVNGATGDGVQSVTNGSGHPYSWYLEDVQISNAGIDGFRFDSVTDSTFIGCRAIGCVRRGWYVNGLANSTFYGCRSEFSGERGWYITGSWGTGQGSGGAVWTNCSTDRSTQDGVYIDATGSPVLQFVGLMLRRDGRNGNTGGGNFSGLTCVSATVPIMISGIGVYPGVDDDGSGTTSPQRGINSTGSTWVVVDSGYIQGATTAVNDGGTNTLFAVGPTVGIATGTTAAPTRSTTQPSVLPGPLTLTLGGYIATRGSAANTAVDAGVTGDTVTRYNVTAGGDVSWGAGGASARDITLGRTAANVLSLTTADFRIVTLGRGLRVAEGANAKMGTGTLNGATEVTISTTAVTASSRIFLSIQAPGGTPAGAIYVSSRIAGTSFGVKGVALDTSTFAWMIVEPS